MIKSTNEFGFEEECIDEVESIYFYFYFYFEERRLQVKKLVGLCTCIYL